MAQKKLSYNQKVLEQYSQEEKREIKELFEDMQKNQEIQILNDKNQSSKKANAETLIKANAQRLQANLQNILGANEPLSSLKHYMYDLKMEEIRRQTEALRRKRKPGQKSCSLTKIKSKSQVDWVNSNEPTADKSPSNALA